MKPFRGGATGTTDSQPRKEPTEAVLKALGTGWWKGISWRDIPLLPRLTSRSSAERSLPKCH
ncbi:MAG: hypothetical protein NTW36_13150 [Planctomycetia bacterium]|nr:hypothetical protein [Planctomycetia bacterium]